MVWGEWKMVKAIRATVYECEYYREDVPWEKCRDGKRFRSVTREEMEGHEKGHRSMIARVERDYDLRDRAREIIAGKIRIGEWADWEELFDMLVIFSRTINRQPFLVGQSLGTYQCALGLLGGLIKFIWLQTNEPRYGYHPSGVAWDTIHLFYDEDRREKSVPKDFANHQIDLKNILERLNRRISEVRAKFGSLEGVKDLEDSIEWMSSQIRRDAETIARQKIVESAVSA